jgi:hypothetical protein
MSDKEPRSEHADQHRSKKEEVSGNIRYVPVDIRVMDEADSDIDLIEILKTLWDGRKTIFKTIGVFIFIGLAVALFSVVEFTSEVKVMPETQQGMSLGALGGLAQQFGFSTSVQQSGDEISANLFPSIVQSNVFLQELMNYEVTVPEGAEKISLAEYIKLETGFK